MKLTDDDEKLLVEKGIFTKEEFVEVEKRIKQEMQRKIG
jgi:hypothetical protein